MTDDSAKPIKTGESDRPQPISTRLRQTRASMLGTDDEQHYWDCHEAAAEIERLRAVADRRGEIAVNRRREIERLRTIMYRIVDEDCTVAIQGGKFYADDEPLFAISDTTKPRNGAVDTPDSQPTPGEGSTP